MIKKSAHKRNHQAKGIAMITVIAITGLMTLLISLMMIQHFMRRSAIKSAIHNVQNFYTAESGIKKAFYYLTKDETKGIQWRTGDLFSDSPLEENIFYNRNDRVEISVIDDCGCLRITSRVKANPPKLVEIVAAGEVPDNLKCNLQLVASKPLILASGSHVSGRVRVNQELIFQGGSIDAVIENSSSLSMPSVLTKPFGNAIQYFRHLLSDPGSFGCELFSPQIFSMQRPFLSQGIFVNDMVLIENRSTDSTWHVADGLTIASTGEVQISGKTRMNHATIVAIGPVKVMDQSEIKTSKIYSETSVELRDQASFSGVLIAPEIRISDKARLLYSTLLYSGSPFKDGRMSMDSEAPIYCTIFNLSGGKNSLLEISLRTKVTGFIYARAPITLRGEVEGCVLCQGFHENPVTPDTTNTNIISGTIRPAQSAVSLFLPVVFSEINDFRILEWVEY
jgi:hypothetical protein